MSRETKDEDTKKNYYNKIERRIVVFRNKIRAMIVWLSPLASLAKLFVIARGQPGDPPATGKNALLSGKCGYIKDLLIKQEILPTVNLKIKSSNIL